jgi:hypothetical protein
MRRAKPSRFCDRDKRGSSCIRVKASWLPALPNAGLVSPTIALAAVHARCPQPPVGALLDGGDAKLEQSARVLDGT